MPPPWPSDLDDIPRRFLTFWVAENDGTIVGMAGLVAVGNGVPEPVLSGIASHEDAVRLTRMRSAPEWQRCGIGSRLVATVLSWSRERGRTHLVLETTAEQAAAIALYRRRGFAEVTRSTLGPWELVWMRRAVERGVITGGKRSPVRACLKRAMATGPQLRRSRSGPVPRY